MLRAILTQILAAVPECDDEWGSDRQIEAENKAFNMAQEYGVDTTSFETTKESSLERLIRLQQMGLDMAGIL